MKVVQKSISEIKPYEKNPRKNDDAVEYVANSIKEFGFKQPIVIDNDGVIVAGHTRYKAAKKLKLNTVPCIVADDLTEEQIRAYRLADNKVAEASGWDFSLLDEELDEILNIEMVDFGFENNMNNEWFDREDKDGKEREEGNDEYNDFLEKFEPKKTTDDCYTPEEVYEAVANFVESEYGVNKKKFFRPFYPGGDYQKENYNGKIVVDNPPFSILAEIKRFYAEHEIKFFLFAPSMTLFSASDVQATYITCGVNLTYENGANVLTSFVTNLDDSDIIVKTAPKLYEAVYEADKLVRSKNKKDLPKYEYPDNILTAAAERAAAERPAIKWKLSERELDIVHKLGNCS